ncbi:MAG: hypothetical protein ACOC6H_01170 [Thermoproteota archaeon]
MERPRKHKDASKRVLHRVVEGEAGQQHGVWLEAVIRCYVRRPACPPQILETLDQQIWQKGR